MLYNLSMTTLSLQQQFGSHGICFGCGPQNKLGLQLNSYVETKTGHIVARFLPQDHHQAFPGVLNGGIIGALLDCHCNWAAAYHLMLAEESTTTPCTVTADYHIKLKRPTPTPHEVELRASIKELTFPKAIVEASLSVHGKVCATCIGTFVAVGPEHPAYFKPE